MIKLFLISSENNNSFGVNIVVKNLSKELKKSEFVMEVVNFLEKDKKRPICTPFSK